MGSALPLYTLPSLLSSSPSPIDSPPPYPNMSEINLHKIIHQQQEQLAAMQVQIQALLTATGGTGSVEREVMGPNMGPHMEVAKLAIFNREAEKVGEFVIACRLYLRMKMREATVEKQVQWVLLYIQGGSADI